MDDSDRFIPDLEYRAFMLRLAKEISSQDLEEIKYALRSRIPAGIRHTLDTALRVFDHLENIGFVGPNNLFELERLFNWMGTLRLGFIVSSFIDKILMQITEL